MLWDPRAQSEVEVVHPNTPELTLMLLPPHFIHRAAEARG